MSNKYQIDYKRKITSIDTVRPTMSIDRQSVLVAGGINPYVVDGYKKIVSMGYNPTTGLILINYEA